METRIQQLLAQWHEAHRAQFVRDSLTNLLASFDTQEQKHTHVGAKYARLDVGSSGAWMLELETGIVFGIKGYGTPDKKKIAGDINDQSFDGAILFRDRFRRGRFDNRNVTARYKVHCGGQKWARFATLDSANRFCNEVIVKTGDVLTVLPIQAAQS